MKDFIKKLDRAGELLRIREFVDPYLEISEISDRMAKSDGGGKAVLFENNGTNFPVLTNAFGSEKRIEIALGRHPRDLASQIHQFVEVLTKPPKGLSAKLSMIPKLSQVSSWLPRKKSGKGQCQQRVKMIPDLGELPVLTCWPKDGGPFITLPMVHTVDPDSGIRNLGMYRMQVYGKNETGMHWQIHKTGARHFREYQKLGRKMEVTVTLGGDPVYTYCATAPLPEGIDEYMLAGFIRKKPVKLVKCLTNDLWIPEDVDFVIEGYVDPVENFRTEGPFGDHTGFYSLEDTYPVFHVTAITNRNDAVYPATIVGIPPQEDKFLAWATEEIFRPAIKLSMIPELFDMHLPPAGVAHNLALFSVDSQYPGQARKVIHTVWGAGQMMFTKFTIILPQQVNLRDYEAVLRHLCDHVNPMKDIEIGYGPLDVLDHASDKPFEGGKMGIDATGSFQREDIDTIKEMDSTVFTSFRSHHPEIFSINTHFLRQGISLCAIALKKTHPNSIRELADDIRLDPQLSKIRFWILYDDSVDIQDPFILTWLAGSHTDISRDAYIYEIPGEEPSGLLVLDCTFKTQNLDAFNRPWPNPVVMDQDTITKVDRILQRISIPKMDSPSRRYQRLSRGDEAVAKG